MKDNEEKINPVKAVFAVIFLIAIIGLTIALVIGFPALIIWLSVKGWPLLVSIGGFFQGIIAYFQHSGFYFNLTVWSIAAMLTFLFHPVWQKADEKLSDKHWALFLMLVVVFGVIMLFTSLSHYMLCAKTINEKAHLWEWYNNHVVRFVGSGLEGSPLDLLGAPIAFLLILPYFFLIIFPSFFTILPIALPVFSILFPPEKTGHTRTTVYSIDSKGNRQVISSKTSADYDDGVESAWLFNDFGRNMRKFIFYQAAYVAVFVWIYFCW
jgi:hypothetical protein